MSRRVKNLIIFARYQQAEEYC